MGFRNEKGVKALESSGKSGKKAGKLGVRLNTRKLAKKGLTVQGGGAIIINVVARTATQTAQNDNDDP